MDALEPYFYGCYSLKISKITRREMLKLSFFSTLLKCNKITAFVAVQEITSQIFFKSYQKRALQRLDW